MIARISPRKLRGTVAAIPSKSEAHRALICAALADAPTRILMGEGSEDISATIRCLTAFGAKIERADFGLRVEPIIEPPSTCDADCGESGSTLRFLLPVAAALGIDARFHMRGRLPDRPIAPLDRELTRGGCEITRPKRNVLRIRGGLRPGEYELPGDVSSQYISGLLFALPLLDGESRLRVTGRRESVDYVAMTLQSLSHFGVEPEISGENYIIGRNPRHSSLEEIRVSDGESSAGSPSPKEARIGGDWVSSPCLSPGEVRVSDDRSNTGSPSKEARVDGDRGSSPCRFPGEIRVSDGGSNVGFPFAEEARVGGDRGNSPYHFPGEVRMDSGGSNVGFPSPKEARVDRDWVSSPCLSPGEMRVSDDRSNTGSPSPKEARVGGDRASSPCRFSGEVRVGGDGSNAGFPSPKEPHGGNRLNSPYHSPGEVRVGGDWSNAAFWLCADALPGCSVDVTGLDVHSAQGDRCVADELRRMRAGETVLDAADIPDLVPILAATACAREQALRVTHAGRLRIKESDRLASVSRTLCALGGDVTETEDGLIVAGKSPASEAPSPIDPRIHTDPVHTCDADAYWPGFAEEGAAEFGIMKTAGTPKSDSPQADPPQQDALEMPQTLTDAPTRALRCGAISTPRFDGTKADSIRQGAPEMRQRLTDAPTRVLYGGAKDMSGFGETEANSIRQDLPETRQRLTDAPTRALHGGAMGAPGFDEVVANSSGQDSFEVRQTQACALTGEAMDAPGFDGAEANSIRQNAPEVRQTLANSPACALTGGTVDACGDHRIAMMAAIVSCACAGEVVIRGAEAVNKSYPGFWRDFAALGGCVELTED